MADPSESASDAKVALPRERFRTIVSLLLFVHLFCVGLGILTSTDAGTSSLLMRIKTRTPLVQPYLWQLWLDHGYGYHLISFLPMQDETASYDWDYHLEATLNHADGRQETLDVPEAGVWPSDRRHRLEQLPKFMAMASKWQDGPDTDEFQNDNRHLVGGSIGAGLLRQNPDAESVNLRWYYHRGLTGPEVRSPEPPAWSPTDRRYFVTVGTMRVELAGDQPESIDPLPKAEVSPLKPRTGNGKSNGSAGAADAPAAGSPAAKSPAGGVPEGTVPAKDSSSVRPKPESN